jgi:hypothetical protein
MSFQQENAGQENAGQENMRRSSDLSKDTLILLAPRRYCGKVCSSFIPVIKFFTPQ